MNINRTADTKELLFLRYENSIAFIFIDFFSRYLIFFRDTYVSNFQ